MSWFLESYEVRMKHTAIDKHLTANDEAEKLTSAFTSISLDDSKKFIKNEPAKLKRLVAFSVDILPVGIFTKCCNLEKGFVFS